MLAVSPIQAGVFPPQNGKVLEGVRSVDPVADVLGSLDNRNETIPIEPFVQRMQAAFESALRSGDLVVERAAQNFLLCTCFASLGNDGLVHAYCMVEYFGKAAEEQVHPLLWSADWGFSIGASRFRAEDLGRECSDRFLGEWRKRNAK